jgi:4-amino-4-deoxy-L-arabinose transferase-like glycosyltransferase
MLVYWFTRQVVGGLGAAFAVACFLLSPMTIQRLITAENDGTISFLLFAAFAIWWTGSARGGPSVARWVAIGLVLAVASLVQGPQPLCFFFAGVGIYLVGRRKWDQLAGLVLAGLFPAVAVGAWYWAVYQSGDAEGWIGQWRPPVPGFGEYVMDMGLAAGQLALQLLPALLLVVPLLVDLWRRRIEASRELVIALCSYAACSAAIAVFWPGNSFRAMPVVPAVAVLAGIAYHHFLARLPRLVFTAQVVAGGLLAYVLILNWVVMPLFPGAFSFAAGEAEPITAAILERPAPVYVVPSTVSRAVMYYLPKPHLVPVEDLAKVKPPFWAILNPADEETLKALRPDLELSLRLQIPKMKARLVDVLKP